MKEGKKFGIIPTLLCLADPGRGWAILGAVLLSRRDKNDSKKS